MSDCWVSWRNIGRCWFSKLWMQIESTAYILQWSNEPSWNGDQEWNMLTAWEPSQADLVQDCSWHFSWSESVGAPLDHCLLSQPQKRHCSQNQYKIITSIELKQEAQVSCRWCPLFYLDSSIWYACTTQIVVAHRMEWLGSLFSRYSRLGLHRNNSSSKWNWSTICLKKINKNRFLVVLSVVVGVPSPWYYFREMCGILFFFFFLTQKEKSIARVNRSTSPHRAKNVCHFG